MALTKINGKMARAMALKSKRRRKPVFVSSKQLLHPRLVHQTRKRRPFHLPSKKPSDSQALDPLNMSSSPEADRSPSPPSPPPPDELQSSFLKLLPRQSPPDSGQSNPSDAAKLALQKLLADPIKFVPATKTTMDTEIRTVPKRLMRENRTARQESRFSYVRGISKSFPNANMGAIGMYNPANWCYRRGVLQSLMNLPVFLNWIERHQANGRYCSSRRGASYCIACALKNLYQAYWDPGRTSRSVLQATSYFDKVVASLGSEPNTDSPWPPDGGHFNLYSQKGKKRKRDDHSQQCAGEFAGWLFQQLDDRGVMPKEETNALFMLEIERQWNCIRCKHAHKSDVEAQSQIIISLRDPKRGLSFEEYVDKYFLERLSGPRCDACRTTQDVNRRGRIVDGPEVLFVQLQRVGYDPYRGGAYKIHDVCPYPLYLDLSKHSIEPSLRAKGNLRYKLSSVVQHAGEAGSGHYTAKVVSPLGVELLNDESPAAKLTVERLLRPKDGSFLPYLLTYVRVRPGDERGR
ncbi:uncharacterized protein K452DRAFT_294666 [Aplosporella prunicola CBS 121167]|uniref:USP domain-containing protein n=1 Tax=Aplosporella prunicola CBS 121167 TaxID=1176127 RepID=A0A6A6BQM9_9PEZI|nr:uncharacterized protein K452DRAFT_294666 [Aplosporella prunicola CBS 121167]KAF2146058.1 hypothetical protein K452DRAFT_294666 [Aplosporella prunicola CBS 121167]